MTPLPINPTIILLENDDGEPLKVASNIAPVAEMTVLITNNSAYFDELAKGNPFNETI